jgi:hypothetical protein
MVVNELVTLRAQNHQVPDIIDVRWAATLSSARAPLPECDDVSHLGKVAFCQGQMVSQDIFVAPVKFAPAAGANEK